MKIQRIVAAVLLVPFILTTMSCNTIGRSNMSYLGADAPTPNVTGRGTHTSWAGLGVTGASYARTYEQARAEAFRAAERRLDGEQPPVLYNIKAFREDRRWPQIVAIGLGLVGFAMIQGGQGDEYEEYNPYTRQYETVDDSNDGLVVLGSILTLGAAGLAPVRVYDMWIIADYASAPEQADVTTD
jgi:hypothetical protein